MVRQVVVQQIDNLSFGHSPRKKIDLLFQIISPKLPKGGHCKIKGYGQLCYDLLLGNFLEHHFWWNILSGNKVLAAQPDHIAAYVRQLIRKRHFFLDGSESIATIWHKVSDLQRILLCIVPLYNHLR